MELQDPDAAQRASSSVQPSGNTVHNYHPRPVDLSNMTLSRDNAIAAEKMAENAHLIWCTKALEDIAARGGGMPVALVQWDQLTDFERRKNRFRAQEILKFLQYHGYKVAG